MNSKLPQGSIIGILGGGQLGRMSALAAANLGYKTHIYSDLKNSPASFVAYKTTIAPYDDRESLKQFANEVDIISFEFENIPYDTVKFLEKISCVRPSSKSILVAQNRIREKTFLENLGINVAQFYSITNEEELREAFSKIDCDCILKTTELGYDGKGQVVINSDSKLQDVWKNLNTTQAILEKKISFKCELSVILARDINGNMLAFPPAENVHKNGILDTSICPANVEEETKEKAIIIAKTIAYNLDLIGILAVELFLDENNNLLVNEIAPRPHNSGHYTMDACVTSQFEQYIKAIAGLPFSTTKLLTSVEMKNLIGDDVNNLDVYLQNPNAKIHLYDKVEAKAGRKMGHVNIVSHEL